MFAVTACNGGDDTHLPSVSENNQNTCEELISLDAAKDILQTKGFNEELYMYKNGSQITSNYSIDALFKRKEIDSIFQRALAEHDEIYKGNTPVESYYRNHLRKRYYPEVVKRTMLACLKDKKQDLNKAITNTLNDIYQMSLHTPIMMTCADFEKKNTLEDILKGMKSFDILSKDKYYDRNELNSKIKMECSSKSQELAKVVVYSQFYILASKIEKLHRADQQREEEIRENQERLEQLDLFGKSTVTINDVDCKSFIKQYDLSKQSTTDFNGSSTNNSADIIVYQRGLALSLDLLVENIKLKEEKKNALRALINNNKDEIAQNIISSCNAAIPHEIGSVEYKKITLNDVAKGLDEIYEIKGARTKNAILIEKKYEEQNDICKTNSNCNVDINFLGVKYSKNAVLACEVYNEKEKEICTDDHFMCVALRCFNVADDYFSYYRNLAKIEETNSDLNKINDELISYKLQGEVGQLMDECQHEAVNKGYMDEKFQNYVDKICTPRIDKQVYGVLRSTKSTKMQELEILKKKLTQ